MKDMKGYESVKQLSETEADLRRREDLYRTIFDNTDTATIVIEEDTTISLTNTCFEALSGYSREEIEGRISWTVFVHEDDLDNMRLYHEKRRTDPGSAPAEYEFRLINRQGQVRYMFLNVRMIPGTKQSVVSCRDITERKHVEDALRQSEERYRNILEHIEDIYFEVDLKGNIAFVNRAGISAVGYTREEIIGSRYSTLMEEEDARELFDKFNEVYLTDRPTKVSDWRLIRKDGSTFVVEASVTLKRDYHGNIEGFLGILRDVTERRLAEDALRESEKRYRMLAENVREVIWTIDYNLRATYMSPSVEHLLGYTPQEAMAQPMKKLLASESYRYAIDMFKENTMVKPGQKGSDPFKYLILELEHIRKDGSTFWGETTMTHLFDEDGFPIGVLGVMRDITDRKRSEQEKNRLERQLLHAQRMEAVGTLAGGIAHDFNNLLTGIQGNVSLLLLDIDSRHPHADRIKYIEQYVQRGAELSRQLLGFARGGKYEVKPTDMADFIGKSSSMFGRAKKEVRITTRFQEGLWVVEVDQGQMEQVLLNLFVNAWHAMPDGGDLRIFAENVMLDEDHSKTYQVIPGRYVRIAVSDSGIGMDEKTKARIFDPFFTTKEMGRGTGLGLASVYGIIKNHNGIIDVESEKNKGATFIIYLPASGRPAFKEKDVDSGLAGGIETILLVDDENIIINIGTEVLERLGYKVLTAGSGREAVRHYQRHTGDIDLVILDIIMPDMSGSKTYEALKEINPDVCVLLSSGYSIDGEAKHLLEKGCSGFIQKPFNIKELSCRIRDVLNMK